MASSPAPSAGVKLPDSLASKLDEVAAQYAEIERQLQDPDVAGDHRRLRELSIKRAAIAPVADGYNRYRDLIDEVAALRKDADTETDPEMAELTAEEIPRLEAEARELIDRVKADLVQSDDRRVGSSILEVRAGTGGDEAGLWARDLLSMYERFASRKGWKYELLDASEDGGMGGLRSAVASIQGDGVFAELGFEAGVHAVKRVPATESQGRIHTSTATVAVLPEPEASDVKIDWAKDVAEHVTTAQGPGGQNVNKVATAVHLVHEPTGIEVRMQETKSQAQNREKARRLLAARVAEQERQRAASERAAERRSQIGAGERSERIRVYRYQDGIVADQRLETKFQLRPVLLDADMGPLIEALLERETARRLAEL